MEMEEGTSVFQQMLYGLIYVSIFLGILVVGSATLNDFFAYEVTEDKIPLITILNQYAIDNIMATAILLILLITLSSYRLTRFVVYDSLTEPFRIAVKKNEGYFFKMLYSLISCPWCFGVWSVLITIIILLSFGIPGILLLFILAISGIVSFLMILTNLIGWNAEYKKKEVQRSSHHFE